MVSIKKNSQREYKKNNFNFDEEMKKLAEAEKIIKNGGYVFWLNKNIKENGNG